MGAGHTFELENKTIDELVWMTVLIKLKNSLETPEIWVKTVYGICLNAECKKVN